MQSAPCGIFAFAVEDMSRRRHLTNEDFVSDTGSDTRRPAEIFKMTMARTPLCSRRIDSRGSSRKQKVVNVQAEAGQQKIDSISCILDPWFFLSSSCVTSHFLPSFYECRLAIITKTLLRPASIWLRKERSGYETERQLKIVVLKTLSYRLYKVYNISKTTSSEIMLFSKYEYPVSIFVDAGHIFQKRPPLVPRL